MMGSDEPTQPTAPRADDAKRYQSIKLRLSVADMVVSLACMALVAFSGISRTIAAFVAEMTIVPYFQFMLFVGLIGAALWAIGLPLDVYSSYVVEHRFGLSNQTPGGWIAERVKSFAVGLVIGVPVGLAFYAFLIHAGGHWWLFTGAVVFLVSMLLARVAPQLIFPLFYSFTPLADGEVAQRLREMVRERGIDISGVYSFNLSRDSRKANAGFAGMGRGRRIIISDTLLAEFTPDEIAAVFAHELGHYMNRHIAKNVALGGVIIFAALYLCGALYEWSMAGFGVLDHHDLAALPMLFFYLALFGLVMVPLTNAVSRHYERAADRYALEATGRPAAFISAMEKIARINLADTDPHPVIEVLWYSHPSIRRRIAMARGSTDSA